MNTRGLPNSCSEPNNRKELDDSDRFNLALSQIVGKRLTYKELTGKINDDQSLPN